MGVLRSRRESGQILLIVVLAAVISLTVGLSVASRVITNTKTTTDEVNAQKALSAAETGVEQSLKSGQTIPSTPFAGNSSKYPYNYQSTATAINNSQFLVNGGNLVSQDDGADIWLSTHGSGTGKPQYTAPRDVTLRVYWKDNSSDCTQNPAIELIIISGTSGGGTINSVKRYVYDPCTASPTRPMAGTLDTTTETDLATPKTISNIPFNHYAQVDVTSGLIARVIPLYADATLAVEMYDKTLGVPNALVNPPAQGYLIQSTGTAGNVTRTLRVFQGYPKLPTELFPYTLFIP